MPTTPITQKTQSPLVVATSVSPQIPPNPQPTMAAMQAQLAAIQASQTPLASPSVSPVLSQRGSNNSSIAVI